MKNGICFFSELIFLIFIYSALTAQESKTCDTDITKPSQTEINNSSEIISNQMSSEQFDQIEVSKKFLKDSTQIKTSPKLLPQNISFMESFLWGESGFFRKVGFASELNAEARKNELNTRRTMLSIHQIGGFLTLDMMIVSTYLGQRVLDGKNYLSEEHKTFRNISIGLYSLTSLLSVLSPPPLIRRQEQSTITIHKTLAWIHFAGTIISPIVVALIENDSNKKGVERYRQIASYVSTVALATSFIIITF